MGSQVDAGFGFFDLLGFGETAVRESLSDSSVAVTEELVVGLGVGSGVAAWGEVSGVGVTVATGPSGDRVLVAAPDVGDRV